MTFQPTHVAPPGGLHTWERPDASLSAGPEIPAGLPLELIQRLGDWAEVRCSNDWAAWVDGRALAATHVSAAPVSPGTPAGAGAVKRSAPLTIAFPSALNERIVLLSGAAVAVVGFFPWISIGSASITAWKVPAAFLVDSTAQGAPWLAWLLLAVGAAVMLVALTGGRALVVRSAGGVVVAVPTLFAVQVARADGVSVGNVAAGAWLMVLIGACCMAAPALEAKKPSRTAAIPMPDSTTAPASWDPAPVTATASWDPAPVAAASQFEPVPPAEARVWIPTHRVPSISIACFGEPDIAQVLPAHLEARLEVSVDARRGEWAHVTCSNGWSGWVDGRLLEPVA